MRQQDEVDPINLDRIRNDLTVLVNATECESLVGDVGIESLDGFGDFQATGGIVQKRSDTQMLHEVLRKRPSTRPDEEPVAHPNTAKEHLWKKEITANALFERVNSLLIH